MAFLLKQLIYKKMTSDKNKPRGTAANASRTSDRAAARTGASQCRRPRSPSALACDRFVVLRLLCCDNSKQNTIKDLRGRLLSQSSVRLPINVVNAVSLRLLVESYRCNTNAPLHAKRVTAPTNKEEEEEKNEDNIIKKCTKVSPIPNVAKLETVRSFAPYRLGADRRRRAHRPHLRQNFRRHCRHCCE
jgi:hypothetical protein